MIITRTPLRISFAGGGSDFRDFYERDGGFVVSSAIDKYVHVILRERFDKKIYVGYSQLEIVDEVGDITHEIVRECLGWVGWTPRDAGLEIKILADVPGEGTGLGSSSALTVGLLHALGVYQGRAVSWEELAEDACQIEIGLLSKPIGKQDQYIAAAGGLRSFGFDVQGAVYTHSIPLSRKKRDLLSSRLMLFYTGITRKSAEILDEQRRGIPDKRQTLLAIRDQAKSLYRELLDGKIENIGSYLKCGWQCKRRLAGMISTPYIDEIYDRALRAGATGGKIAGAGGGGFLLLDCPPEKQESVRQALHNHQELVFNLEPSGSRVLLNVQ